MYIVTAAVISIHKPRSTLCIIRICLPSTEACPNGKCMLKRNITAFLVSVKSSYLWSRSYVSSWLSLCQINLIKIVSYKQAMKVKIHATSSWEEKGIKTVNYNLMLSCIALHSAVWMKEHQRPWNLHKNLLY